MNTNVVTAVMFFVFSFSFLALAILLFPALSLLAVGGILFLMTNMQVLDQFKITAATLGSFNKFYYTFDYFCKKKKTHVFLECWFDHFPVWESKTFLDLSHFKPLNLSTSEMRFCL